MTTQGDRSQSSLTVRRAPFEFPADIPAHWNPGKIEWGHMVNGASLAMPYLEPYLIKTVRAALAQIDDPQLQAEARDYCAQEGQHYRQHRLFNDRLIEQGYDGLRSVEARMERDYAGRLSDWSMEKRLAYTAGFETMALSVGHWLTDERKRLFGGADPVVASLILWHFVEEVEHKNTAFDVYQAVVGKYPLRIYGLFCASFHVMLRSHNAYKSMLKKDGLWNNPWSRIRLWRMTSRFLSRVVPHMLRCCAPRHNPRDIEDPEWIRDWITAYGHDDAGVPLLDTANLDAHVSAAYLAFN